MLRKIRLTFAMICFALITLLFLDFTGTLHGWFGWLAKIQFLPAVLALNVGVILFLVILTLVCGRIYCSVICPLGVFQDILAWLGRQPKKRRKLPYSYSPALSWLRYGVLGVFIIALIAGIGSLAALLAPYSAYGRIANNLFQPIWQWGNNLLAYLAERADSYAFYETDVWLKSLPTFIIAAATLAVLVVLAGRNGRTYCNTICPVGTVLGFLSRYSLFRITIDSEKCNQCSLCSRNCKAACINFKEHLYDELAKRKIPAVIMEPLLGGRLSNVPDHIVARLKQREPERSVASWAFRYAGSPQDVLTVLSGMTYMEHLQDNIRTYSPLVPLTEEETQYLYDTADLMMEYPTIPCNDCKYCMPCPYGIDIPAILIHYNKCVNEGNVPESSQDENYRKARRAFLVGYDRSVPKLRQADHCTGCNQCSPHCPQTIDIPKELHRIDKFVEQLKQETL